MKKATIALPGLLFAAAFFMSGKVFAEENTNATEAAVQSFKAIEASLLNLPEDPVPLDEEIEDEEVIDADA